MCVVAEPQNILNEYRLIVYPFLEKQHILTGSKYKIQNKLTEENTLPNEVIEFAHKVLDSIDYRPDPFWVLDIAETKKGYSVLEVNSISCSGYYGCNLTTIAKEISRYVSNYMQRID